MTAWLHHAAPDVRLRHRCDYLCQSYSSIACADIGMSWRNAGNEIIIEALCPKDLQPKDLKCSFNSHTLLLEVAGKPIATGKLSAAIKPDECTWEFGPLLPHHLDHQ